MVCYGKEACYVAALRHLDECAAAGDVSDTVVLGLTTDTLAAALTPFADADVTLDIGDGEICVCGKVIPARLESEHELQLARTWLSSLYAVRVYVDTHGCLPRGNELRLPLVDCPRLGTKASGTSAHAAVPYLSRRPESADSFGDCVRVHKWLHKQRAAAAPATRSMSTGRLAAMDALLGGLPGIDWRAALEPLPHLDA